MANPSNFQITRCVENHENFHLYRLRRKPAQCNDEIIKWPVYEIPDPKAEVVARAQGRRFRAGNGNWHSTFSLVFEDGRFKGSTLRVMGTAAEQGEWDIVGGAGLFARATGVISKKLHDRNWAILELAIHTFRPLPKGSRSLVSKIGPWGGKHGKFQDITEAPLPRRLESITVCRRRFEVVNSIAFSYIDHTGQKRTAGPFGGSGGESKKIELDSSEFVTRVSGTFDKYKDVYKDDNVITSLKFVTNVKTYGPFGRTDEKGTKFTVPVKDSSVIVGFFGLSGKYYLHAVGVYVHPF